MFEFWIVFVIGAVLSWGIYVPVLHEGQRSMGGSGGGALRAFLCVGIAYFITAVLIPLGVLLMASEGSEKLEFRTQSGEFNTRAVTFATLGGIAGAAGALCIIFAIKNGGNPLYIAPLVFAGAPIVNSIVSLAWHWPATIDPRGMAMFIAGILLAAIGAGLVLYSKGYIDAEARKALLKAAAPTVAQAPAAKGPSEGIQTGRSPQA
jgi:uncharacterized membrane protein